LNLMFAVFAVIPGVTGDWRYPGGGVFYDTRGFFGLNWAALGRDDLRPRETRALDMKQRGKWLPARRAARIEPTLTLRAQ